MDCGINSFIKNGGSINCIHHCSSWGAFTARRTGPILLLAQRDIFVTLNAQTYKKRCI